MAYLVDTLINCLLEVQNCSVQNIAQIAEKCRLLQCQIKDEKIKGKSKLCSVCQSNLQQRKLEKMAEGFRSTQINDKTNEDRLTVMKKQFKQLENDFIDMGNIRFNTEQKQLKQQSDSILNKIDEALNYRNNIKKQKIISQGRKTSEYLIECLDDLNNEHNNNQLLNIRQDNYINCLSLFQEGYLNVSNNIKIDQIGYQQINQALNGIVKKFMKKVHKLISQKNKTYTLIQQDNSSQTIGWDIDEIIKNQEKNINNLNNQLHRLKHSKNQTDKEYIKSLQMQKNSEIKVIQLQQNNQILTINNQNLQNKINKISIKCKQIEEESKDSRQTIMTNNLGEKTRLMQKLKQTESKLVMMQQKLRINKNHYKQSATQTFNTVQKVQSISISTSQVQTQAVSGNNQKHSFKTSREFNISKRKSIIQTIKNKFPQENKKINNIQNINLQKILQSQNSIKAQLLEDNFVRQKIHQKQYQEEVIQKHQQSLQNTEQMVFRISNDDQPNRKQLEPIQQVEQHQQNMTIIQQINISQNRTAHENNGKVKSTIQFQHIKLQKQNQQQIPNHNIIKLMQQVQHPKNISYQTLVSPGKQLNKLQHLKNNQILQHIDKNDINLFINLKQAEQYEKGQGSWAQIDNCIIVDNKFTHLASEVQSYLFYLHSQQQQFYYQYLMFLKKPAKFYRQISKKNILTEAVNYNLYQNPKHQSIRDYFRKIIRMHRLKHRNCTHIQQFLNKIGFVQSLSESMTIY